MDLTSINKTHIDSLSYESLLSHQRFAEIGDEWFTGETGTYWLQKMKQLKEQGVDHVGASKRLGW